MRHLRLSSWFLAALFIFSFSMGEATAQSKDNPFRWLDKKLRNLDDQIQGRDRRSDRDRQQNAPDTPANNNPRMVEEVQKRLNTFGYSAGAATGSYGQQTREAIQAYNRDRGRPVGGDVTRELIEDIRTANRAGHVASSRLPKAGPAPQAQQRAPSPNNSVVQNPSSAQPSKGAPSPASPNYSETSFFLLTEGDIRVQHPSKLSCSSVNGGELPLTIQATMASSFSPDKASVQKALDRARPMLSKSCGQFNAMAISGEIAGVEFYKWSIAADSNWQLKTDGGALPNLASSIESLPTDYSSFPRILDASRRFLSMPEFEKTGEHALISKKITETLARPDGDEPAKFREFLKKGFVPTVAFSDTKAEIGHILRTIELFASHDLEPHKRIYEKELSNIQIAAWTEFLEAELDADKPPEEIFASLRSHLGRNDTDAGFIAFSDNYVATWLKDYLNDAAADWSEAFVADLGDMELFLYEMRAARISQSFQKTNEALNQGTKELSQAIEKRLSELQQSAIDVIGTIGASYEDTDKILEAGFALAEEFEDAGFPDSATIILQATTSRIEAVVAKGLPAYTTELKGIKPSLASIAAIEEQIGLFEEMAGEFEGYAAYQQAALAARDNLRNGLCARILDEIADESAPLSASIAVGDMRIPMRDFACSLYKNGHMVTAFTKDEKIDGYRIDIQDRRGEGKSFKATRSWNIFIGRPLKVEAAIDEKVIPLEEAAWNATAQDLLRPPPHGKPDAKGVTECDQLAADPHDPKKLATGVDFESPDLDINKIERGIEACIASVEHANNDARQQFQLGRILWFTGEADQAKGFIASSSTSAYPAGQYLQAMVQLTASTDHNSFVDAYELLQNAANGGYPKAAEMIKQLNPNGLDIYREIPPPREDDVIPPLSDSKCVNAMGVQICVKIVGVNLRQCFQTGAQEFACEWSARVACDTNLPPIYQQFAQSMCSVGGDSQFNTFRKQSDGRWQKAY